MADNFKQDEIISVKWQRTCDVILLLSQASSQFYSSITWPGSGRARPLLNHLLTNNVGHWKTRMTDRCVSQQAAESGPPSLTLRTPETSEGRAERSGLTFWFYTDGVHAEALGWSEISFLCKITRLLPHKCCWCCEKICSCQILWTACLFLPSSIIVTLLHCHIVSFFFSVRHFQSPLSLGEDKETNLLWLPRQNRTHLVRLDYLPSAASLPDALIWFPNMSDSMAFS